MILSNPQGGLIFVAFFTGIMMVLFFALSCVALSDRKGYTKYLVYGDIVLALTFLITGFLGVSMG